MTLAKSTCYSYRKPRFGSQHLRDGSQPSVIVVPEHLIPSADLCGHQERMAHDGKTPIHIK